MYEGEIETKCDSVCQIERTSPLLHSSLESDVRDRIARIISVPSPMASGRLTESEARRLMVTPLGKESLDAREISVVGRKACVRLNGGPTISTKQNSSVQSALHHVMSEREIDREAEIDALRSRMQTRSSRSLTDLLLYERPIILHLQSS
jgi:hypothetical protein